VVTYATEDGRSVKFTNRRSRSTNPNYKVGQEVGVWYRESEPSKAIIYNSWWSLWWGMVVFPLLGVVFIAAALVSRAVAQKGAVQLTQGHVRKIQ
jgi:hypothetical protein